MWMGVSSASYRSVGVKSFLMKTSKNNMPEKIADDIEKCVRHIMDDDNFGDDAALFQAASRVEVWLATQRRL